jgi:hypothetical protein
MTIAAPMTTRADLEMVENKAINFIRALAKLDPAMQLNTALVLLFIARNQDREGGLNAVAISRKSKGSLNTNR